MSLMDMLGEDCGDRCDGVWAYCHFIHQVLQGKPTEYLHGDGVPYGVQKHLCCVGPRRLSLVDCEEGCENLVA